jgi:hypothetical protein
MRVKVLRWEVEANSDLTRLAYAGRGRAGPEQCGCLNCRNFAAARLQTYPSQALEIFASLGVEPMLEAEAWHYNEIRPGLHFYGGCFHAAGQIVSGADAMRLMRKGFFVPDLAPITTSFRLGVTQRVALLPASFQRDVQWVQLEFMAQVPWVLAETPE